MFSGIAAVVVAAAVVGIIVYRANANSSAAGPSSGHTISGTVNYPGSQSLGRVYLGLVDGDGMDIGVGTSIPAPGPYSIAGVPAGTYTLRAWMDTSDAQIGFPNAVSPGGNVSVTIGDTNLGDQTVVIYDPSGVPTPTAPTGVRGYGAQGAALVQWAAPRDSNGNVLAESYNVYYGTSANVTPADSTKSTVRGATHLFIGGLTDGMTYYFSVVSVLAKLESPASDPVAVTAGASSGQNTVTGSISFPLPASGPMYVGLTSQNGTSFQRIDQPVSPQPYSVSGVPSGGCIAFAFVDMNNNGVIDTGDLSRCSDNPTLPDTVIAVAADMAGVNQTLVASNVLMRVNTIHFGSSSANISDVYSLEFEVTSNLKLPVNVRLVSGPNVSLPVDLSGNYYFRAYQTLSVKPRAGDRYALAITYSDGTSETVRVATTDVLVSFPRNMTTTGSNRLSPTFNWAAPEAPPADYTYMVQVGQTGVGLLWTYPPSGDGMPSSQTAVSYNIDGTAGLTALLSGEKYTWMLYMIDSHGNQAVYQASYAP